VEENGGGVEGNGGSVEENGGSVEENGGSVLENGGGVLVLACAVPGNGSSVRWVRPVAEVVVW
jgi:hypothetical protein